VTRAPNLGIVQLRTRPKVYPPDRAAASSQRTFKRGALPEQDSDDAGRRSWVSRSMPTEVDQIGLMVINWTTGPSVPVKSVRKMAAKATRRPSSWNAGGKTSENS
jgi:hypothetical protein